MSWYNIHVQQPDIFLLKYSIELQWLKKDDRVSLSLIFIVTWWYGWRPRLDTEDVVHLWAGILDVELIPRVSGNKAKSTH